MKNITNLNKTSLKNLSELCVEELNEKEMETVQGGNTVRRKSLMPQMLQYLASLIP